MTPRREWLAMLARMSTPHDPVKAMEAMLHYLPLLADMPDAAFTPQSLEAVAMAPQSLHIRTLREVKEPLSSWWRDNKPRRTAIAAPARAAEPEREEQTPEQRAEIARQMRDLIAKMAPAEPERPRVRAHVVPATVLDEARERLRAKAGRG